MRVSVLPKAGIEKKLDLLTFILKPFPLMRSKVYESIGISPKCLKEFTLLIKPLGAKTWLPDKDDMANFYQLIPSRRVFIVLLLFVYQIKGQAY